MTQTETPYCTCLSPIIQLIPEEKCLHCGKGLKSKRKRITLRKTEKVIIRPMGNKYITR